MILFFVAVTLDTIKWLLSCESMLFFVMIDIEIIIAAIDDPIS